MFMQLFLNVAVIINLPPLFQHPPSLLCDPRRLFFLHLYFDSQIFFINFVKIYRRFWNNKNTLFSNLKFIKMQNLKSFSFILSLSFLFFISACTDDTTVNNVNSLSGQIFGEDEIVMAGISVGVNYGSKITADANGKFTHENPGTPYNLSVFSNSGSMFYHYKQLSNLKPGIKIPVLVVNPALKKATVELKYPRKSSANSILYSFLSTEKATVLQAVSTDTTAYLFINWNESGPSSISGKLLFLQAFYSYPGIIGNYEKFGYKEITLTDEGHYNITFTENDINFNPSETFVRITLPAEISSRNLSADLYFKGYSSAAKIRLLSNSSLTENYITVPLNLPVGSVKLGYNFISSDTIDGVNYSAEGFMEPGTSYTVEMQPVISLLYPANDTTGLTTATDFVINESGKVYQFSIGNYSVFTHESVTKIPLADLYGIQFPRGTQMYWNVTRYNTDNIDFLTNAFDKTYPTYNIVKTTTKKRRFTTIHN
jgi:hypothetical protein